MNHHFNSRQKLKLVVKLLAVVLRSPRSLLKHLTRHNIRRLLHALRHEDPAYTVRNVYRLMYPDLPSKQVYERWEFGYDSGSPDITVTPFAKSKDAHENLLRRKLSTFLSTDGVLNFSVPETPVVSIILVLFNEAHLTLQCLDAIQQHVKLSCEVILVDNASTDETSELLKRITGSRIIRNSENLGFATASNQGAGVAVGKHLLFLNNDAEVFEGSVETASALLDSDSTIGAVGGRIVALDGCLQEAGSIIWQDGSCMGYGRGLPPGLPQFMFQRGVDFCSAAFLMTPDIVFKQLGGFDSAFSPAYYEDADYCLRLWQEGYRVVYEPRIRLLHFEFASSESSVWREKLYARNRKKLVSRHKHHLQAHIGQNMSAIEVARFARSEQHPKLLMIDDRIPHMDLGSGFPRSNLIANTAASLGYQVTLYPFNIPNDAGGWNGVYRDLDHRIEVMQGWSRSGFDSFLHQRSGYYDFIWISRPQNMEYINDHMSKWLPHFGNAHLIYDAEAVFADRIKLFGDLTGQPLMPAEFQELVRAEVLLSSSVSKVVTVNRQDARVFATYGSQPVEVLNVIYDCPVSRRSFDERTGLLFVGNLDHDHSPNVDSLLWFADEIYPVLAPILDCPVVHIVGSCKSVKVQRRFQKENNFVLHGRLQALGHHFDISRVFIAPTRYAAGSPAKVIQAASYGLPVMATKLLAQQLEWKDGKEIMSASHNDPKRFIQSLINLYQNREKWMQVREEALLRIDKEYSMTNFKTRLTEILQ